MSKYSVNEYIIKTYSYEIKNKSDDYLWLWFSNNINDDEIKDVLNVLKDFGVLDSTDVKRELGLLPDGFEDERVVTIDHEFKSTHYYVCKRNMEKYKKVVTNKAFDSYEPSKLKCNRQ